MKFPSLTSLASKIAPTLLLLIPQAALLASVCLASFAIQEEATQSNAPMSFTAQASVSDCIECIHACLLRSGLGTRVQQAVWQHFIPSSILHTDYVPTWGLADISVFLPNKNIKLYVPVGGVIRGQGAGKVRTSHEEFPVPFSTLFPEYHQYVLFIREAKMVDSKQVVCRSLFIHWKETFSTLLVMSAMFFKEKYIETRVAFFSEQVSMHAALHSMQRLANSAAYPASKFPPAVVDRMLKMMGPGEVPILPNYYPGAGLPADDLLLFGRIIKNLVIWLLYCLLDKYAIWYSLVEVEQLQIHMYAYLRRFLPGIQEQEDYKLGDDKPHPIFEPYRDPLGNICIPMHYLEDGKVLAMYLPTTLDPDTWTLSFLSFTNITIGYIPVLRNVHGHEFRQRNLPPLIYKNILWDMLKSLGVSTGSSVFIDPYFVCRMHADFELRGVARKMGVSAVLPREISIQKTAMHIPSWECICYPEMTLFPPWTVIVLGEVALRMDGRLEPERSLTLSTAWGFIDASTRMAVFFLYGPLDEAESQESTPPGWNRTIY